MSDINERETIKYFIEGIRKAKSAARELATLNSSKTWVEIRSMLGQLEKSADKLYNAKPQTDVGNLVLANKIEKESIH